MSKALIIGCGGVAQVGIHKCCQNSKIFNEIMIASRTLSKCERVADSLKDKTTTKIQTRKLDASNYDEVVALIKEFKPDIVMHLGMAFHNLIIMDACLECKVHYLDAAAYEPENTEDPKWRAAFDKRVKEKGFLTLFDYSWQWAYREKFKQAGITGILGCGFDPGVTQAYCAYALKHEFDSIEYIDILDCNGGDHGYPFATNFNPELNLREVSVPGSYWEDGKYITVPSLSIHKKYDFDGVGEKDMYLLYHEEIESIVENIPGLKRVRFFMTFGQSYIDHMNCLKNVGMLSTKPIQFQGREIVPIKLLKALLPDPASLGPRTKGKTNIGCIFHGTKDGKPKDFYIYNICDHEESYKEVGSQAVSYTTGVPAMCGAMLVLNGTWNKPGVYTLEELDPDPFMDLLCKWGLPHKTSYEPAAVD